MSKKLLLADDSITIRKVVGIIFSNEDFSLTVVDNGNAALEKARETVPDIMLIDVLMPGKDGYEVCEETRSNPDLKDTPLLLMTGAFEPFDEEKAKSCGADDFISKPFESQQLLEKVRTLIELGLERKSSRAIAEPEPEIPQPAPPEPAIESFVEPAIESFVEPAIESFVEPAVESFVEPAVEPFAPAEESSGATEFLLEEISPDEELVEALPEDDLWGGFDLEELEEEAPVEPETVLEPETADPFAELTAMDYQTLGVEQAAPSPEPPPAQVVSQPEVTASSWQPEPEVEETFTLGDEADIAVLEEEEEEELFILAPGEEPAAEDTFQLGEDTEMPTSISSFEAPDVETGLGEPAVELEFAPEEEYVPVIPPAAAMQVETPAPAPAETAQPAAGGEPALSEEQLASLISKVSREIIEKIAWEVVPDLAEMLIREEIRKIKKGTQDQT